MTRDSMPGSRRLLTVLIGVVDVDLWAFLMTQKQSGDDVLFDVVRRTLQPAAEGVWTNGVSR